jgi:signal transduction histidine kinase
MRYRAERVGATFHIERNLPQGTVIRVSSFLRA